jgi:hypothetical protein
MRLHAASEDEAGTTLQFPAVVSALCRVVSSSGRFLHVDGSRTLCFQVPSNSQGSGASARTDTWLLQAVAPGQYRLQHVRTSKFLGAVNGQLQLRDDSGVLQLFMDRTRRE